MKIRLTCRVFFSSTEELIYICSVKQFLSDIEEKGQTKRFYYRSIDAKRTCSRFALVRKEENFDNQITFPDISSVNIDLPSQSQRRNNEKKLLSLFSRLGQLTLIRR